MTKDNRPDFLTEILAEGQELEINFSCLERKNFEIEGRLTIKEQELLVKPKIGVINSPNTHAWICTHPKYWRILCGLESADVRTNVNIMGMLIRAGLYELSEMMSCRIDEMMSPVPGNDRDMIMPEIPKTEE